MALSARVTDALRKQPGIAPILPPVLVIGSLDGGTPTEPLSLDWPPAFPWFPPAVLYFWPPSLRPS